MRVVSLVPSATETALALGLDVVACTRFCEQPGIETVGGTKNPDIERIAALAPDVVLVDEDENRAEDAVALRDRGVELFVSAVRDVAGAIRFTVALAERCALAVPDLAAEPSDIGEGRCVVVPIWRRPWMSINRDTYGSSVLAHLGFVNAFADAAERYPAIELADLGTLGPELVVVPSEPYEFSDAHLGELHVAVPDAAILRVDGRDLFWWGIRTPGALERLADALSVGSARPPA